MFREAGSRATSSTQDQKTKTGSMSPRGSCPEKIGDGLNAVSESTASDTELTEFLGPHRAPRDKLGEALSGYYLFAKANSLKFSQDSPSCCRTLRETKVPPFLGILPFL